MKIYGEKNGIGRRYDKIPTMSTWHEDQLYIKKTLEDVKALSEAILARQHKQDIENERQKWKHGFLSVLGGVLGSFSVKLNEWFHP